MVAREETGIAGIAAIYKRAAQAFTDWVEALYSQGGVRVVADDLFAMAQQIERGADLEVVMQATMTEIPEPQL